MEYALCMQTSKKANVSKYRKFENISSSHDVNAKRENANVGCRKVLLKGRRFEISNVPKHLITRRDQDMSPIQRLSPQSCKYFSHPSFGRV